MSIRSSLALAQDAFLSPASPFAWTVLGAVVPLAAGIIILILVGKKRRYYALSLALSLIPICLGTIGTLVSLNVMTEALQNVPSAQVVPARATGMAVSLSSILWGLLPSVALWALATVCFAALLYYRRKSSAENGDTEKLPDLAGSVRYLAIGVSVLPLMFGAVGGLRGVISSYDASANVPASVRPEAIVAAEQLSTMSVTIGVAGCIVLLTTTVLLSRRKTGIFAKAKT